VLRLRMCWIRLRQRLPMGQTPTIPRASTSLVHLRSTHHLSQLAGVCAYILGSAVTDRVCDDAEALLGRGHALPGCMCSGDDWDCYGAAQRNLVAMLARTTGPRRDDGGGGNTGGCAVVLTGDYHWCVGWTGCVLVCLYAG
jgi:hypothetical protein